MAKKPSSGDWHQLRLWQIQPVRDLLILAGILGLLYVGYRLSIVTVPLLLALMLAYLFEPLIQWLTSKSKHISRHGVAAGIIVAFAIIVIVPTVIAVGFAVVQGASVATSVAANTTSLVEYMQAPEEKRKTAFNALPDSPGWRTAAVKLRDLKQTVDDYKARRSGDEQPAPPEGEPPPAEELEEWKINLYRALDITIKWIQENAAAIGKTLGEQAIGTGASAVSIAGRTVGSIGLLMFTAFLTGFFFFFFSTGWGQVLAFWEGFIPERKKSNVVNLLQKMDRVIAGFIRGRLIICAALALFVTIMYFLIGVPVPLILGPLVGMFFLVPFLHILAMPIAMLALWLEPSGVAWQAKWWWIILAPIGVNMLCQVLDDYVLTPLIQGKNTDMSTPSILFASIAGGTLAGFYGLLLAIPAAACIKIMLKEVFMPRFEAWAKGKEKDFLPIGREDPPE